MNPNERKRSIIDLEHPNKKSKLENPFGEGHLENGLFVHVHSLGDTNLRLQDSPTIFRYEVVSGNLVCFKRETDAIEFINFCDMYYAGQVETRYFVIRM